MNVVSFFIGAIAITTVTVLVEAAPNLSASSSTLPTVSKFEERRCNRLNLLLKSIASVVGVASLLASLVGIPCNVSKRHPSLQSFRCSSPLPLYL